jgi:twitching motility protein PilT
VGFELSREGRRSLPILDVFAGERRARVAARLAESLVAVLCQRLLPRLDQTGCALALEVLAGTPAARSLVREGRTAQLDTLLRNSARDGMQSMDDAIRALVRDGIVSPEDAAVRQSARILGCDAAGDGELSAAA